MRHFLALACGIALATPALADAVIAPKDEKIDGSYDIVHAEVTSSNDRLSFVIDVAGTAGGTKPSAHGNLLGSAVHAYVWPTSLDSAAVGFEAKQGIVALAVTAHPDFDDTPSYDENGDGDPANDGNEWHSHWVVLAKDDACAAGLKVKDVAPGSPVKMPATAPGLPLFLDSPDIRPSMAHSRVTVVVPMPEGGQELSFDGVAAGLRVNTSMAAPLLCVTEVFKVASGNLSLPGRVTAK